jgi:hypothetical protein
MARYSRAPEVVRGSHHLRPKRSPRHPKVRSIPFDRLPDCQGRLAQSSPHQRGKFPEHYILDDFRSDGALHVNTTSESGSIPRNSPWGSGNRRRSDHSSCDLRGLGTLLHRVHVVQGSRF